VLLVLLAKQLGEGLLARFLPLTIQVSRFILEVDRRPSTRLKIFRPNVLPRPKAKFLDTVHENLDFFLTPSVSSPLWECQDTRVTSFQRGGAVTGNRMTLKFFFRTGVSLAA
jgi:hypothetical protein